MKENCDDTPRKLHERTNMGRLLPKPGFRYSEKGGGGSVDSGEFTSCLDPMLNSSYQSRLICKKAQTCVEE